MITQSHSIANDVRLKRTQFAGAFLICEGATDGRFLRRFIDNSACRIVVAHDKATAIDVLKILDSDNVQGCLAIVDADFDRYLDIVHAPSVVLTPHNDLDVFLFLSSALKKVLIEHGSVNKLELFESKMRMSVRDAIISEVQKVAALRLVSHRHGLNLRFDDLQFSAFVDRNLSINEDALIKKIKNHSNNHAVEHAFLQRELSATLKAFNPNQCACVGHDVTQMLAIALTRAIGNLNQSQATCEFVESQLRLSYEEAWFPGGLLWESLKQWESRNSPYRVLQS